MRLQNGEVLLHWPLDLHVLTQGWYYNNGSLHQATDWRTQNGTDYKRPVYAAEDGTLYKCVQAHTSQADWTPGEAGNPVYHPLSTLVGLYVTVVEVN